MNLSSTIKSIQDIMRKDDGVDGDAQRLGQLTWMLFLKVFDQREEEWEGSNPKYKSPLPQAMRWRSWAASVVGSDGKKKPQVAESAIISFVNTELFPTLKALDPKISPQHKVIRSIFEDANNYMKSGTQLLAVIKKLEEAIDFHDFKTRANLGDVYEQLLNDLRGAGNAGEFYTPRAITHFMIDRLDPSLDKRETVLDPACGTGGFLTAALDHLRNQLTAESKPADKLAIERLIRGIEKKPLPHLLCTTNMLLHGIDEPSQILRANTLGKGWDEWQTDEQADCIVSNPPFGGYEDDTAGSDYPLQLRTRETADMFMALIIKKLLKDGGRAAVVLPDGFLFGDGTKAFLKEILLRDCRLHTIVRLPRGVFAPYTTIKTNLLFFSKGAVSDKNADHFNTDTIWYYEHPYPPGYKSYSKTKPIRFEEFAPEQEWWGSEANDFAYRVENEFAWKVDFKAKRDQARALAMPHWNRAEQLENEVEVLDNRLRGLRGSIKSVAGPRQHLLVDEIESLRAQSEALRLESRDARAAGDRLYWPIYNLDMENPNTPQDQSHDPDVLLGQLKTLIDQTQETENRLKSELAAALAYYFVSESTQ